MKDFSLIKRLVLFIAPILVSFSLLVVFVANASLFDSLLRAVIILSLICVLSIGILTYVVLNKFIGKLHHVTNKLKRLSEGDMNEVEDVNLNSNGLLADTNAFLSEIYSGLKGHINLIQNIIDGNLNVTYTPLGKNDVFGAKLVELSDSLEKDKQVLNKTKDEEQRRNWVSNGLAKFSEILRLDTQDIKVLSYNIISNLVAYNKFNQGAFYVLNDENTDNIHFELVSAIAYDRQKNINSNIKVGEGLVGRCAFEKMTIYMSDIPESYLNITSGLGKSSPRNLVLVPCVVEDKIFGIIELASFNKIEDYQIEFVEKLGETIASTIANTQMNEKTSKLLEESKLQGEELAAQEEELRQNLEEMETTQEDLKRQMESNKEMREELSYEKFLFDTLLKQIPSRIFFKDTQGCFVKASKSIVEKFGKNSYEELIGLSDLDLMDSKFAKKTMADENLIMETRQARINFEEHEVNDKGESMWKTVSKLPLINEDKRCIGTFGIITDITDFKLAEIEKAKCESNYSKIFQLIDDNLCSLILDTEGNIKHGNQKFCDLFHVNNQDIQNISVNEFYKKYLSSNTQTDFVISEVISDESYEMEREYKIQGKQVAMNEKYITQENANGETEILMISMVN